MFFDTSNVFFKHNEEKINQSIIKLLPIGCISGVMLIFCRFLNIFPDVEYTNLILFTVSMVIITIVMKFLSKSVSKHFLMKYFLLMILELLVFYVSITKDMCVFIAYLLVPIIACLYYNVKFLIIVDVTSYFITFLSIVIRAINSSDPKLSPLQWGLAYGFGVSLEYIIVTIILYELTIQSHDTLENVYEKNKQIKNIQQNLISGFANLVESKDATTGHHIKRTSAYVKLICEELRKNEKYSNYLTDETIQRMVASAPLHDLGKISIPDVILCKPKMLTSEEFAMIKQHPVIGDQLIRDNMGNIEDKEYIAMAREMALHHHEWWNGNGYPDHLQGSDIPLSARIISTADVMDALLSKRSYKEPYSVNKTYDIINSLSDIQFDPEIVDVLENIRDKVELIATDQTGQVALQFSEFD